MSLLQTIWCWLPKVPKTAPRIISDKFSVVREILVQVKLLLHITEATVRIASNKLCLLQNTEQFLGAKCLYFKKYGIGGRMLQIMHPQPLLTNIQFIEEWWYRSNFYFL